MRSFLELQKHIELEILLRSKRGYLYVEKPDYGFEIMCIRHFNGELPEQYTLEFAQIIEAVQRWITERPEIERYVFVESVIEVGKDFIILPNYLFNCSFFSLQDPELAQFIPEEMAPMQKLVRSTIGNPANEQETIVEEVIERSLLEPSSKTYFDEEMHKFIIIEPRITADHLERWAGLQGDT